MVHNQDIKVHVNAESEFSPLAEKQKNCASQTVSNGLVARLFGTRRRFLELQCFAGAVWCVCCIAIKRSELQPFISCHWCVYASFEVVACLCPARGKGQPVSEETAANTATRLCSSFHLLMR